LAFVNKSVTFNNLGFCITFPTWCWRKSCWAAKP